MQEYRKPLYQMLRGFGQCTIVGLGLGARYIIGFKRLKGVT